MKTIEIANKKYSLNAICDGINNNDYHRHQAISSTNCKDLLKSPWLYDYNKKNPKEQTAAMAFGSLAHHLILEPETFDQHYFVADKPKRNTNAGKAAYERLDQERGNRAWVTQAEFLEAEEMRYNVSKNDLAQAILTGGKAEQAVFWRDAETDVLCKAKADYLNVDKGIIVDLKTTSSLASEMCFKQTVKKYHYQLSAAFYQTGFTAAIGKVLDFFIIALKSFAPFNYAIYKVGEDLLQAVRSLYQEALRTYQAAHESGQFNVPYYHGQLIELAA